MAASWRNRTLSLVLTFAFKVFTATSTFLCDEGFHMARATTPNSPDPNSSQTLQLINNYQTIQ